MSVGRKRTTEHEKDAIKQFNALIKEHSLDAVKNIVKISNRAMDENVRLKANVWIAEKLVGKSYSIADVEGNVQDKYPLSVKSWSVIEEVLEIAKSS